MSSDQTTVIVGAGLAGAKAAEELRLLDADRRIVLVGEEPVRPYERPPLSKSYLRGESDFDAAAVHEPTYYDDHQIELVNSTRVASVDLAARAVETERGERIRYHSLLLATGAEPRRLSIPGAELAGVHYLRSVDDSDRLRTAIERASGVVVVGAGWIGSEVAASAREMGKDVTIVETAHVPLERVLGSEVGMLFADLHREHGVDLRFGVGVEAFRGSSRFEEIVLADGSTVAGDLVVVGVGVTPRTELAVSAGLAVDNGVLVDEYLATSAPGVWAVGDVANAYHRVFDTHVRLEHWASALNQGPVAARNIAGGHEQYDKIPYFFSDQYDLGMEYTGYATKWDRIVYRGDLGRREVVIFWLDGERVVAGMNVNVWDVADAIAELVRNGRPVDLDRLADPSVDLADVAI